MTANSKRIFILTLIATIAWPVSALAASASDPEITIAVRKDARPFIWVTKDTEKGTESYEGFFWHICAKAVDRARYRHKEIQFNASDRRQFLELGTTKQNEDVDLLCDPTTITLARMDNFDDLDGRAPHLQFSPIIFVANGSFVQRPQAREDVAFGSIPLGTKPKLFCKNVIETAKKFNPLPNAPDEKCKTASWWNPNDWSCKVQLRPPQNRNVASANRTQFEVWGFVEGSTIGDAIQQAVERVPEDRKICTRPFASHAEAAKAFCEGKILRYFGDVEIVKAALRQRRKNEDIDCPADVSNTSQGTYEPYAFVVSAKNSEFPERFRRALHGMFMDGTIDKLFKRHFPKSQKSPFLSTLFRIQSIPSGRQ